MGQANLSVAVVATYPPSPPAPIPPTHRLLRTLAPSLRNAHAATSSLNLGKLPFASVHSLDRAPSAQNSAAGRGPVARSPNFAISQLTLC